MPEQLLSARFIKPSFTVLELGGNIGRNSLIISSLLDSGKQLLTVEPNKEICALLIENRDANNLSFHIESRALSKRKLWSKGWNTHLSPVEGSVEVDIISFDDLQSTYGLTFDTLVIDCEGAFYHILNEDENIMKNINLVIIENDFSSILHKKYVDQIFVKNGLKCIHTQSGGFGPCRNNFYEAWSK